MEIPFRPLNLVHELMSQIGYEPGYAYDDLVFSNDGVFIVQFGENARRDMKLFINKECDIDESERISLGLNNCSIKKDVIVNYAGMFALNSIAETEEIQITFYSSEKNKA